MSQKRIYSKDETELMLEMYKDGETYSDIGKLYILKHKKFQNI